MSHDLEHKNGRYSFAYVGDAGWHELGTQLPPNATRKQWIDASGFDYRVVKCPALCDLRAGTFDHVTGQRIAPSKHVFLTRADNAYQLGVATHRYEVVQPHDIFDWFERTAGADDRFHMDAAGVLKSGERLWATARYGDDYRVAGERHIARLLMSTSFDLSQATINQMTDIRVVCSNTLAMAHADSSAMVKTRHTSKFDGDAVAKKLAKLAQSIAKYKAIGDALAQVVMTGEDVAAYFGKLLAIDPKAKASELSTRKSNQMTALIAAYNTTKAERNTQQNDAWTALNAVTRYVDHSRSTRNGEGENDAARFDSATFGSGNAMKGEAMGLLLPLIKTAIPA